MDLGIPLVDNVGVEEVDIFWETRGKGLSEVVRETAQVCGRGI